jgi:hypothetical protein
VETVQLPERCKPSGGGQRVLCVQQHWEHSPQCGIQWAPGTSAPAPGWLGGCRHPWRELAHIHGRLGASSPSALVRAWPLCDQRVLAGTPLHTWVEHGSHSSFGWRCCLLWCGAGSAASTAARPLRTADGRRRSTSAAPRACGSAPLVCFMVGTLCAQSTCWHCTEGTT